MLRVRISALASVAALALSAAGSRSAHAQATGAVPPPARAVDRTRFDTTCTACNDFYRFANGGWQQSATIPADYSSAGVGREINDRNQATLHAILDRAAADRKAAAGSAQQKLGAYYGSCMDSTRAERLGATPLKAELSRIAAVNSPKALAAELGRLHPLGVDAAFGMSSVPDFKDSRMTSALAWQGGLGLPDRDYYTKTDSASAKIRAAYVPHVARTLQLLGDSPAKASDAAARIIALETKLAEASLTRLEQRDIPKLYHLMSVDSLQKLMPAVDLTTYYTAAGATRPKAVIVAAPQFMTATNALVNSVPMSTWRDYLRWRLADAASPSLSSKFVKEQFTFTSMLVGTKAQLPRWKRCLTATDEALGEVLGQAYVAEAFSPAAKARALEMVKNLESALHDRISGLEWMSDSTRTQAIAKLDAFAVKIGYPDSWRDYSGLSLGNASYYDNRARANAFEFRRQMAKAGKPTDRAEWGMTPQTLNAYNNPFNNEIVFPAGILQPPFFDANADDAVNYGAMGAVIGHEISHGFDDQGRQFDAQGNLRDWWTAQDAAHYAAQTGRIVNEYNTFVVADTFHVNGKLTLGENIADLGGVKIAYAALQKALAAKGRPGLIDGFTPEQRFFLAFAGTWRAKVRPEAATLQSLTDPHSPPRWRVNGVLVNLPEFAQAFGCRPTDQMVRADSVRATIW